MRFHIITLFPETFDSYVTESIIGRAIKNKKIQIQFYEVKKYAPKHLKKKWPDGNVTAYVDGKPFGGGPGMVLRAEPFLYAHEKAVAYAKKKNQKAKIKTIFFSPGGTMFSTEYAKNVTKKKYTDIIFICGRYEGIDARVQKITKAESVSIGNYVLTGGELPAMVCIDCMARQIPGVLGNFDSREEERIASHEVYTRPEILEWQGKKHKVPPVLLSGNPKLIDEWKKQG